MDISIRHAAIEDYESISKLSNQLGYSSSNQSIQNRLEVILEKDDTCVFVARDVNHIIGWIHGFHTHRVESDSFVEIGGLIVQKEYRQQGIGKLLVKTIIEWAQSLECEMVRVRSNTRRIESQPFYEGIGFMRSKQQHVFDLMVR